MSWYKFMKKRWNEFLTKRSYDFTFDYYNNHIRKTFIIKEGLQAFPLLIYDKKYKWWYDFKDIRVSEANLLALKKYYLEDKKIVIYHIDSLLTLRIKY